MVRFAWTVGEGISAHAQRHRSFPASEDGGLHLAICVEISGRPDVKGVCFTVPPKYLQSGMVKDTGFLIAHGGGRDAATQNANNKLHSELAMAIASQGHVVVRCQCVGSKESQDQSARMAARACASSPYGLGIKQWIVIGIAIGANAICRVHHGIELPVTGIVLFSLPLDAASVTPGKSSRNSKSQDLQAQMEVCLRKVNAPLLFVQQGGQSDGAHLRRLLDVTASVAHGLVRMLLINKKAHEAGAKHFQPYNMKSMVKAVQEYMESIMAGDLSSCELPAPEAVAEMVVEYSAALGEDAGDAGPIVGKGGSGKGKKAVAGSGGQPIPKVKVKTVQPKGVAASSGSKRQAKPKETGEAVGKKRRADRAPGAQSKAKLLGAGPGEADAIFEWREDQGGTSGDTEADGAHALMEDEVRFVTPAFGPAAEEHEIYEAEPDEDEVHENMSY